MIASSSMPQEDLLFSSPETLQQLRQQLLSLDQQDHHSLQAIQRDISLYLSQFQQISNQEASQPFSNNHLDLLRDAQTHLRQRSNCILTLSQLAVRMIDCIREQQEQHIQVIERYQSDLDALRDQNDCLASKNNYIEVFSSLMKNDVEYFREHLRAAESQLESIALEEHQEDDKDEMMKDQMIGKLEEELERIRGELEYYRFSSRSKQSRVRLNNVGLNANPSTNSLHRSQHSISSIAIPSIFTPEQDYLAIIQRLEAENQGLKREIRMLESRRSKKGSVITREIRQQQVEETEMPQIQPLWQQRESFSNDKQGFNKTSSLSIFQKGILHDFRQSLESPRFDEECFTPAPLQHRVHPLSSEWSTKSFQVNMEIKASRLIYLNQQEEEQLNDKSCKYDRLQPVIQQTKETEGSVREIEIAPIIVKKMSEMGVNTEQPQPPPQTPSYITKLLQSPIPLLKGLSSLLVKKRVRRSVLRANQAMLMI